MINLRRIKNNYFRKFTIGNFIVFSMPFILMEVFMIYLGRKINFFPDEAIAPFIIYNLIWILFPVLVTLNLRKRAAKIFYGIYFMIFFILTISNAVYFSLTGFYFNFNLMKMAGEGSEYILDTIIHTDIKIYLVLLVIFLTGIRAIRKISGERRNKIKSIVVITIIFVIINIFVPNLYGKSNDELTWSSFRNTRNVYNSFSDVNKSMKITGLFEYSARDFKKTFLNFGTKKNKEEIKSLEKEYADNSLNIKNKYTGMFKGKNVIMLQLEGIDSWLLDEKTMPNLYGLTKNAFVYTNHFSYYNGGGSTFNSEFAVNTGFITPISFVRNAYTLNNNTFNTLPKLMEEQGYTANAFHMNSGEYYSRGINYKSWGYEKYNSLVDDEDYTNSKFKLDRELINNKDFYNKIFKENQPFLNYIITYSVHTPFNKKNVVARMLDRKGSLSGKNEEAYARLYAGETDKMIGLMMKGLEKEGLLKDTIIVAYADHYLYTLNDKSILDKYKDTSNNLINNTPFFIWSYGMEQEEIDKVNSQVDILPTVLNLLGIDYTKNQYIGNDIMDDNFKGYAFFNDGSYFDGYYYVNNGKIEKVYKDKVKDYSSVDVNDKDAVNKYIKDMDVFIKNIINKNDWTLKYDYLKEVNSSKK